MSLEWPPDLILFLDRGASVGLLIAALEQHGIPFKRHDDLFPQNTLDTVWLREVGRRGWLALTHDQRIRYNALEIQALLSSNVGSFVLTARVFSGQRITDCILKALPAMLAFAQSTPRPFIAKVYADSRVKALEIS